MTCSATFKNNITALAGLIGSFWDLLSPLECPVCGTHTARYPSPICGACEKSLLETAFLPPSLSHAISAVWSCIPYEGKIKGCVKHFKYHGNKNMASVFSTVIGRYLSRHPLPPGTADIIVPVPIHAKRRRERRYNQAEILARILSEHTRVPIAPNSLIKAKNTPPQTGMSRKNRIVNPKNSFRVIDTRLIAGRSILLVDDVITTGATLDACAEEMLCSGAKNIFGFTLARTV